VHVNVVEGEVLVWSEVAGVDGQFPGFQSRDWSGYFGFGTSRGRPDADQLCLSKTMICMRGWDLYFFVILSRDARFCHAPCYSVLDRSFTAFTRCP
jgi:hypothetical protein